MAGSSSPALTARFAEALAYSAQLHTGQVRKATAIPYVSHLLAVCALVLEDGGGEDEAIAALLHDGPEDAGGHAALQEIRERFGDHVAHIVEECSDTLEHPKPPWRERKQRYLAHLEHASDEALRVSLADKLHNVRSINRDLAIHGEQVWKRFNASRQETICNYVKLAEVFARRRPGPMANELTHQVEKLKQHSTQPGG